MKEIIEQIKALNPPRWATANFKEGHDRAIEKVVAILESQQGKEEKEAVDNKKFNQGYTCAVACLINAHGMGTEAADVWRCNRLTKKELITNEIDDSDKEVILKHWGELNR